MMRHNIRRHEDSVIGQIEKFFRENPGEELNYTDIAIKFGVSRDYVRKLVPRAAHEAGILESVRVVRLKASARPLVMRMQTEEQ